MDEKAKPVVATLGVALAMGALADALLRVTPWGINGALWTFVFVWVVYRWPARFGAKLLPDRNAFLALALVFGACLAWRDSATLKMLDLLALVCVFLACVLPSTVSRLREVTITNWAWAAAETLQNTLAGLPRLVRKDAPLKEIFFNASTREGERLWLKQATALFVGILLTIPLLLVFGALFISADRAFEATVSGLFDMRWDIFFSHLFAIIVCTWVVAGYLRLLVFKTGQDWSGRNALENVQFSAVTLAVPLISLDLLFLSFVLVQGRYMFGGEELIQARTGMTYSSYAREGFFQLVVVAILALVFLLIIDWFARDVAPTGRRVLRITTGALVGLVYVVLASALYRMHLYQEVYGFTELRVYTTAFMLWLAVVLFWFLATVLRGRRERFALGALVAGMAVVFGLHVFNPDAYIVRWNAGRVAQGKSFDARYVATLSADAVPALVNALPSLPEGDRDTIKRHLRKWAPIDAQREWAGTAPQSKWAGPNLNREQAELSDQDDWRTWSWSRHRARGAVERVK